MLRVSMAISGIMCVIYGLTKAFMSSGSSLREGILISLAVNFGVALTLMGLFRKPEEKTDWFKLFRSVLLGILVFSSLNEISAAVSGKFELGVWSFFLICMAYNSTTFVVVKNYWIKSSSSAKDVQENGKET